MVTDTRQHGSPGGEAERWDGDTRTAPGDSQPRAASPQPCTNRVPSGLALEQLWPQQPWCPSWLPLGCQGLGTGRSRGRDGHHTRGSSVPKQLCCLPTR